MQAAQIDAGEIDALVAARSAARAAKNWAESGSASRRTRPSRRGDQGQQGRNNLGVPAMTAVSFRPYLPADAARCAGIFRDAIEFSAADDYDEEQRAAWAARADDGGGLRREARRRTRHRRDARRLRRRLRQPRGRRHAGYVCVEPPPAGRASARRWSTRWPASRRPAATSGSRRKPATCRSRCSSASGSRRSAEPRADRRPVARPHHNDQEARRLPRLRPDTEGERCPANAFICSTPRCATAR